MSQFFFRMGLMGFLVFSPLTTSFRAALAEEVAVQASAETGLSGKNIMPLPRTWLQGYEAQKRQKTFSRGPDVHYSDEHCNKCHGDGPATAANLQFEGDDIQLCRACHPREVYHIHVVGVPPDKTKVPEEFPLPGGKITCVTCHDEPSCNRKDSASWKRPFFLRGDKVGFLFCFTCHEAEPYQAYNPHDPVHMETEADRKGNCLFCHEAELPADSRRGLHYAALKGKPNDLCAACHPEEPHFGVRAHLHVTDPEALALLSKKAEEAGPILPLGENFVPLCVSCHDPHMPGLIPGQVEESDNWLEAESSELREEYRNRVLKPFVKESITGLEAEKDKKLVIRDRGLLLRDRRKLLRAALQRKGSMCLCCHDVFVEEAEAEEEKRFDYRMLY